MVTLAPKDQAIVATTIAVCETRQSFKCQSERNVAAGRVQPVNVVQVNNSLRNILVSLECSQCGLETGARSPALQSIDSERRRSNTFLVTCVV